METNRPLPFDCIIMDANPTKVTHPLSGASCVLPPDAIAVFDTILGAEILNDYKTMRKGLDWFMKYFPTEYFILLD